MWSWPPSPPAPIPPIPQSSWPQDLWQKRPGRGDLALNPGSRPPWPRGVKSLPTTSRESGLQESLDALGFHVVGHGCTTCIGNSGPLPEAISKAIHRHDLSVCSVLSGNRNFEGRISPDVKANYLASPPLVVCYALAGTLLVDLTKESLGKDREGRGGVYGRPLAE